MEETYEVTVWGFVPCLDLLIARLQQLRAAVVADESRVFHFSYPVGFPPPAYHNVPPFCGGACLAAQVLTGEEPPSVVVEKMAGFTYAIAALVESQPAQ